MIEKCNHPVNEKHHITSSLSFRLTVCPQCHNYVLTDYSYNRKLQLQQKQGIRIANGDSDYAIDLAAEQGWVPPFFHSSLR